MAFRFLYFGTAGVCGFGYKVYDTYTYNPKKKYIVPYSIYKGVTVGIIEGLFYSVAIPCLFLVDRMRQIDRHFQNKE